MELVLCVPMLVMLVGGMVFTGRQLSYYGSASQTTFNAALFAAGLSSLSPSNSEVRSLGELLLRAGITEEVLINGVQASDFSVEFEDSDGDGRGDLVKVGYQGQFLGAPMGSFGATGFAAAATMPVLGDNLAASASPEFRNPSTLYCPDGTLMVGSSCSAAPPGGSSGGSACGGCSGLDGYCKEGTEALDKSAKLITCASVDIGTDIGFELMN